MEQVALLEWKGGDGIWSVTAPASSPWKNEGVYNNASGVVMGDIDGSSLQTVTIDGVVSPSIMMVRRIRRIMCGMPQMKEVLWKAAVIWRRPAVPS